MKPHDDVPVAGAPVRTEAPPGPRRRIPGAYTLEFWRDPVGSLLEAAREYGDIVHWKFGGTDTYLVRDPEHIRRVLVTDQSAFMKGRALQETKRILGEGLLTSEGDLHERQRRLLQPLFRPDRVASYGDTIAAAAARVGAGWKEGETVDVHREMARLTLVVVGETVFDADLEPEADEIANAMRVSLDTLNLFMLPGAAALERIPIPAMRRFRKAQRCLDRTVARLLDERGAGHQRHGDLLSVLLAAAEEGDGPEHQVRDEAMTILLAGHETTATALTWTWYLLAHHPRVEVELERELRRLPPGRLPAAEDLPSLRYTEMVVREAIRLYPPAWLIGRRALVDYELDRYTIRKGSIVIVSPYVIHHDARFYPEPFAFRPERWTDEQRRKRPRYAYLPFGGGPRACIGEAFAWTEVILVLATLAREWKLESVPGHEAHLEPRVTLRPKGGLPMRLVRRGAS
jgi:cytochrome P450